MEHYNHIRAFFVPSPEDKQKNNPGHKDGNDEDNDYSEKMKHSVIAWYGSTITDSSVLKAENGQKIDVSNEPIWEYEKIKGLYVNKDSRNYSIFYAHNEKDPLCRSYMIFSF